MLEKLFDSAGSFLKAVICGAMLIAAAAVAVTVAFFALMSAYRGMELLWREVFSHSWSF